MQDCYNANACFLFLFDYGISQLFISSRNKIVTIKRYMSCLSLAPPTVVSKIYHEYLRKLRLRIPKI